MNQIDINLQLQRKNSYLVTFLIGHMYLRGLWFFYKEIGLRAQNMIIILGLVVNIVGRIYMTIQCACESSLQ
jgi:hypothetical protein